MEQLDIRILLVNHQELVRCGLQRLLNDAPQLRVVGEASGGEEAIQLSRSLKPDVVLIDVQMPGMGVVETTRRITGGDSNTRVLVVTLGGDDPFPARLLDAGASGYLTKNCGIAEISDAIRVVARGERYLSSDIARQMALSMLPGSPQSPFQRLSRRELQVMLMVAQGQSVHDISDQLCLSSKTISTYRYRLYEKLGVGNDVELAHLAIRHGFLDVGAEP